MEQSREDQKISHECHNLVCFLKNGPLPASFAFIYVFSTVNRKYIHYKMLPMTRLELGTTGIGSDFSANRATITTPIWFAPNLV